MPSPSPWTAPQVLTALAGGAAIIAAFPPWVEARVDVLVFDATISRDGIDTHGRLTLFLGFCVLAAVLAGVYGAMSARLAGLAAAVFGAAILIVGLLAVLDLENLVDADGTELDNLPFVDASAQIGLWLTIAAGAVAALGGLTGAARRAPAP
ncbi:MAG TPA: hypothetical protein VMR52_08320 [Dehalococcoidia bacterium]|nr:hypothetical protein [Dehalococcoidia bacterium]